jgi:hypothetical protein
MALCMHLIFLKLKVILIKFLLHLPWPSAYPPLLHLFLFFLGLTRELSRERGILIFIRVIIRVNLKVRKKMKSKCSKQKQKTKKQINFPLLPVPVAITAIFSLSQIQTFSYTLWP